MSGKFATFNVRFDDSIRRVELFFGSEAEVRGISRWRAPKQVSMGARDSLEFARLASKRWRYYRRSLPTIEAHHEFETVIRSQPRAEVNFIIVARAPWFSEKVPLGMAQCRRTFCHHFIVELLAVHPRAQGLAPRILGVGSGILVFPGESRFGFRGSAYLGRSHRTFIAILSKSFQFAFDLRSLLHFGRRFEILRHEI